MFTCNAHARDSHPIRTRFLAHPFCAVKENLCLSLVEDKCFWDDPSVQVSVLSVQTGLLLLLSLHGDRTCLHDAIDTASNVLAGSRHTHGCPAMFRLV